MIMNYRTAIVVTLVCGCFVSIVIAISVTSLRIPEQSELVPISGRVANVDTITPQTENIVFQLDSSPSSFKYVDSLPSFREVRRYVQPGRSVTVYVDDGAVDQAGDVTVWGVAAQGGRWVVTPEALADYRRDNRRIGLIMLPIFVLLSLAAAVAVWFEFRPKI